MGNVLGADTKLNTRDVGGFHREYHFDQARVNTWKKKHVRGLLTGRQGLGWPAVRVRDHCALRAAQGGFFQVNVFLMSAVETYVYVCVFGTANAILTTKTDLAGEKNVV